ncbi:MAG: phenylacetic acid degradation protein, partial [Burkholderiales bacterium PBB5]
MATDTAPTMTVPALQQMLDEVFADWVRQLQLQVRATPAVGEVVLALPVAPQHVHGGGVVCGQTLMAAADTAMVLAASHFLGGFRP